MQLHSFTSRAHLHRTTFTETTSKTSLHNFIITMDAGSMATTSKEQGPHAMRTTTTSSAGQEISKDQKCHLQRMPAEIRNEIFHLAVFEDNPIEVTDQWPGITGTCKQFREETLAIYFGSKPSSPASRTSTADVSSPG